MASPTLLPAETDSEQESTLNGNQTSTLSTSVTIDTTLSPRILNMTRIELERRQLLHTIQILKLELNQKNMILDTIKTDSNSQIEELEEIIMDIKCERNLLQQKLKTITQVYEEEMNELRVQLSQRSPSTVQCIGGDEVVTVALQGPVLTSNEYTDLVHKDSNTTSDLIKMRVYEIVQPFARETDVLRDKVKLLQSRIEGQELDIQRSQQSLDTERTVQCRLRSQIDELHKENKQIKSQVKIDNFKIDNFDHIKSDRDSLQQEMEGMRQSLVELQVNDRVRAEDRDKLLQEITDAKQSVLLLKQDKEYLSKQVTDLSQRCRNVEEKNEYLLHQLSDAKQSKDEVYKDFVKNRKDQKEHYDQRLQQELEALRTKTNMEIQQIKQQTREMYERENRMLGKSKDDAEKERDKAVNKQQELEEKYQHLLNELHQLQVSSDGRVSDLQSELHMKVFECERTSLLLEEASNSLNTSEKERDVLRRKTEQMSLEHQTGLRERDLTVQCLENKLKETTEKLESYESLEQELDGIIMQAAETENEQEAEQVLYSFGFGTSIPSNSRRRMQQCVHLARRVLKLERINSTLKKQIKSFESKKKVYEQKITSLEEQIELSKEPYKYLIENIQQKDKKLHSVMDHTSSLQDRIRELEAEQAQAIKVRNEMATDLERLMSTREEMSAIRQTLKSKLGGARHKPSERNGALQPQSTTLQSQPQPTIFTKEL